MSIQKLIVLSFALVALFMFYGCSKGTGSPESTRASSLNGLMSANGLPSDSNNGEVGDSAVGDHDNGEVGDSIGGDDDGEHGDTLGGHDDDGDGEFGDSTDADSGDSDDGEAGDTL